MSCFVTVYKTFEDCVCVCVRHCQQRSVNFITKIIKKYLNEISKWSGISRERRIEDNSG